MVDVYLQGVVGADLYQAFDELCRVLEVNVGCGGKRSVVIFFHFIGTCKGGFRRFSTSALVPVQLRVKNDSILL